MARAKHRKGRGIWVVAGVVVASLAVVSAGSAVAAYRYDAAASDRILPGVSIAGVDVSGMRRGEAIRTISGLAEETLYDELTVRAAGSSWTVTPASLGMDADVEGAVDRGSRPRTSCRSSPASITDCATSPSSARWTCRSNPTPPASNGSCSRRSTRSRCPP